MDIKYGSDKYTSIRMVIFWTLFGSGFQMVKGSHLVFSIQKPDKTRQKVTKPDKKSGFRMVGPFEIRTEVFLTSSLERLVMNKIFFCDPLL
jgi:hypothetical protein